MFQEKFREILDRQKTLELKLDRLINLFSADLTRADFDNGNEAESDGIIKLMASSRESLRSKTNYRLCLTALGLPVTTNLEDVSSCQSFLNSRFEVQMHFFHFFLFFYYTLKFILLHKINGNAC